MSTIYILWLRQIKRYFRSKSRIIGALGQPLLYLVALGYGLGPVYQRAGSGNYINFLAPGVIGMSVLFTAIFSGMEMIWDRQFGFLKETFVAPVSRFNIILGRTLGSATVATFQGVVVLFLTLIVGFRPTHWAGMLVAPFIMLAIALIFTGLGTAIAAVLEDMQGFQLIMNFLVMPIFFFSGALFPLTGLPTALAVVARVNPLSFGIDALRAVLTSLGHFSLFTSLGITIAFAVVMVGAASFLFRRMQL
jgi:ABC-2 type transport system permease protein